MHARMQLLHHGVVLMHACSCSIMVWYSCTHAAAASWCGTHTRMQPPHHGVVLMHACSCSIMVWYSCTHAGSIMVWYSCTHAAARQQQLSLCPQLSHAGNTWVVAEATHSSTYPPHTPPKREIASLWHTLLPHQRSRTSLWHTSFTSHILSK